MAVSVFVAAHSGEFFGLLGIILFEAFGKVVVDAGVFLLLGNGQGEDFLFVEAIKRAHKSWNAFVQRSCARTKAVWRPGSR